MIPKRVDTIYDLINGHRGCVLSHIKDLKYAQNKSLFFLYFNLKKEKEKLFLLREKMSFNLFDSILYINLDHRKDRKKNLLKETKRVGIKKIKRVEASFDLMNGARGCVLSHIKALEAAKGTQRTLILEDDCQFIEDIEIIHEQIRNFFKSFENAWDIFFLGGDYLDVKQLAYDNFFQVSRGYRSHAYIINGSYISKLQNCFEKTYQNLLKKNYCVVETKIKKLALDDAWITLQRKDRWYAGKVKLANQGESYSDIEGLLVKYNTIFPRNL